MGGRRGRCCRCRVSVVGMEGTEVSSWVFLVLKVGEERVEMEKFRALYCRA
jgi:hypothetical protein